MMQAAVFRGPGAIDVQKVPFAKNAGESGALLRVKTCAVCGYDARVFRNGHGKVRPPIVLGHELCGELVSPAETITAAAPTAAGNNNSNSSGNHAASAIKAGTRVALCPLVPCLACRWCGRGQYNLCANLQEVGSTVDGGFAEYVEVPEATLKIGGLVPVPDSLGDEEAALLEPLACCVNGLSQVGPVCPGSRAVVIGDGPIGLLHLQLLRRFAGAQVAVVGRIKSRLQKARSFGAIAACAYDESSAEKAVECVKDFTGQEGADIVVVAASNPDALKFATRIAGRGCRINIFAGMPPGTLMQLDANWLHYSQASITGAFSSTPEAMQKAAMLAAEGAVDLSGIVTHRFPLSRVEEALAATEKYLGLRSVITRFD